MNINRRLLLVLLVGLLAAGCQTTQRSLYFWGDYEALLYQSYTTPEKATAAVQLEKLNADLEKARAANLPPPPGWHAHRGYLYYTLGNFEAAEAEFMLEKEKFPESAVFIERLLQQHREVTKP